MVLGPSPRDVFRDLDRHLRNSHALGRLILGGLFDRLGQRGTRRSPGDPAQTASPSQEPGTQENPGSSLVAGLPLPEGEWMLLSSGDVVDYISRVDDDAVRAIGRYEDLHRRRRLVVEAVRRRLES